MAKKSMLTYDGLSHMISKLKAKFTVNTYTHSKSGTVHNFTGTGENGKAKITAEFVSGDTFAVNGTNVSAYVGSEPVTSLRAGQYVYFVIDGSNMYFVSGIAVDSGLSSTSSNPVQNKVVNNAITSLKEDLDESTVQIDLNGAPEGEPVTNNADTLEGKSFAQIEGMMNDKVRVNLLRQTLQTVTINGVYCDRDADGSYTLSGTATSDCYFAIDGARSLWENKGLKYGKDYKLVGCPKGGSSTTYCLMLDGNTPTFWTDGGDGVVINYPSSLSSNIYNFCIFIKSGTTCNNLVFKPMLTTDLEATYNDFISYDDSFALNQNATQKQDVLSYEEIQASTDLSGKIASASSVKALSDKTPPVITDNTTVGGNWCSFIEVGGCLIGINHYSSVLFCRRYDGTWFSIQGTNI